MLDSKENQEIQKLFTVTEAQVNRDHAISHTLAVLQKMKTEFVFFGGTALSRTFLGVGRLSEDIDLYSENRRALCLELDQLPALLSEEFPQAFWNVPPSQTADSQSSLLNCDSSTRINVQVVNSRTRDWSKIPTMLTNISQRYSDAPSVKLRTPILDGFVVMKASAWFERRSPRDLFDLEGLSHKVEVTESIQDLVVQVMGFRLSKQMMSGRISGLWHEELAHQTKLTKTEDECLKRVLAWWER